MLDLRGAFKKNPQRGRERAGEPIPTTEVGKAPACLKPDQKKIWDEMVAQAFWLTGADRFLLEIGVTLMAMFRANQFEVKDHTVLINTLNKLGFGPSERSKLKAPGANEDEENPFDNFA